LLTSLFCKQIHVFVTDAAKLEWLSKASCQIFGPMTLSITTISINDKHFNIMLSIVMLSGRNLCIFLQNVNMLSVVMPNVMAPNICELDLRQYYWSTIQHTIKWSWHFLSFINHR
jgi:hypothetical protein